MNERQTFEARWQGIPLSVSYAEPWTSFRAVYGYALAHVTVTASCPLPITDTGFQSVYIAAREIEAEGGPVAFVLAWLDHDAALPAWQAQREQARQFSLF
jgi:hypothetical protein